MRGPARVALRRIFRVVNGGTPNADPANWDGGIQWATPVDLANFDGSHLGSTLRTLSEAGLRSGSAAVPGNSVIVSTRAPIGYVVQTRGNTAFNQGCKGLVPERSVDIRFYRYVLIAMKEQLTALGQGSTFAELSGDALSSLMVPAPPLRLQRVIADYLDTETARIDALIAKKRTLSARLAEQFESRVFVAVTAGLREAPLVPSGLDWAPRIPETWGMPTVSANFDVQLGKMLSAEATAGVDQQPYLRNVNVQWDRIDLDDLATMHFSPEEKLKFELKPGDLLVCEGGVVGRAAVWAGGVVCFYQKALHRVRPRAAASTRFLMYALRAAANLNVFAVEGNLSTIVHLTREQLNAHRFPWPPVEEQTEIVEYLDHLALKHEAIRRRLDDQISLLKERRHALITAAVTGELEIPGAA